MTSNNATPIEDDVVSLVWSMWAELGVSGWTRNHRDFAIDPEALVLLTAWLHDLDPRLRDEATDWCTRYGKFVSAARLKNLLASLGWLDSGWWSEFAATVNANSRWQWPGPDADPREFEGSQKSRIESFTRPSLMHLRVRAFVGLGARAEILRLLSSEPHNRVGVAQTAAQIGYSKRNTAEALDGLEMAGLLNSFRVRNRLEYAVIDTARLAALVDPRPPWIPVWVPIVNVVIRVLEFIRHAEVLPESVASVECVSLLRGLNEELGAWGVPAPQLVMIEEPAYRRFTHWSGELLTGLAVGDPKFIVGRQE